MRRLAELIARGASPDEVFGAVAKEIGQLLEQLEFRVLRYEGDSAVVVGASGRRPTFEVGFRVRLGGNNAVSRVFKTGKSARIPEFRHASGPIADAARPSGVRSTVATPVLVEGRLWGAMLAGVYGEETFPADIERRLEQFSELMATAIANAEARTQVDQFLKQQAALRRVAELVARETAPAEVFSVIAQEIAQLLDGLELRIFRFDGESAVVVGAAIGEVAEFPIGFRVPLGGDNATSRVFMTGKSARVTDFREATGAIAGIAKPTGVRSTLAIPIVVEARTWGAIVIGSFTEDQVPPDTESRLEQFTELMGTAIANADSRDQLRASRVRLVTAGDEARRRIERDLHDGVQQQLVSLTLALRKRAADAPAEELKAQLADASDEVGEILEALVEIARGIHPAILSQGGLEPALDNLARRSAVPVELNAEIEDALPDAVEVAAYYVVSEALTNVAKHARASSVQVTVTTADGSLTLTVRDDGVGGAAKGAGSGLVGLQDRIEALGGAISFDSSPGNGTCVFVRLPIQVERVSMGDVPMN